MCWAVVGRRIGSFNVCQVRSLIAGLFLLLLLPVYMRLSPGTTLPDGRQWLWLILSSASGMVIGDILTFESFVIMGPRRGGQYTIVAPLAAILFAWLWLGETLTMRTLIGTAVAIAGLALVVHVETRPGGDDGREPGQTSLRGIVLAVAGSVFIGLGAVLVRYAFKAGRPLDPLMAMTVRVVVSAPLLWSVAALRGAGLPPLRPLRETAVRNALLLGTLCGPLVGMFCYVLALKLAPAGLVSALSSMSPLFLIFMVAVQYQARPRPGAVFGTLLALAGVAVVFLA
jgi:drug/metabolite transporter (DMT)-like permease